MGDLVQGHFGARTAPEAYGALPTSPIERYAFGIAKQMRDKSAKLVFRDGTFADLQSNGHGWAGNSDTRVVTSDVLQIIATRPSYREGLRIGEGQVFRNYFTDETKDAAGAHHEVIVQAMIRTPDAAPQFGRRAGFSTPHV